jgi:hypothetical protein
MRAMISYRAYSLWLVLAAVNTANAIVDATPVFAGPIAYTESTTASGSLGSGAFVNESVLLTMTADTATIYDSFGVLYNPGTLTVKVPGLPTATFTDDMQAVDNPNVPDAGFSDLTIAYAVLFTHNSAFSTYDLTTAIGPLVGTSAFNAGKAFPTTAGRFVVDSVGDTTFTATTAATTAVPEPSSRALLGTALLCLALAGLAGVAGARCKAS